jgi:adenylate cyclase
LLRPYWIIKGARIDLISSSRMLIFTASRFRERLALVSGMELKQRLAAILAADAAGYSRLMAADDRATVTALDSARKAFRTQIESNQGRVIDMAGDSVLAIFETAIGAVSAAIAIQQELNAASSEVPEDRHMRFRIGIHLGDVIEKADGTVYGDGVNIAARLEGLAEPGGIAVSDSVRIAVQGKVKATFEDRGEQQVKNIPHPVRMFAIQQGDSTRPARPAPAQSRFGKLIDRLKRFKGALVAIAGVGAVLSGLVGYWTTYQTVKVGVPSSPIAASTADAGPLSIVVLPFSNQTGDAQKAYIADALTSSITSDLSRIRDAFVVSPTTAFMYRDKPAATQQVGKDLGVRFVLQGNVVSSGDKIRISATLSDTRSGAQLWTESFDGELGNLFALQDQVTTRIGNSIGREMVIVAARESETHKSSPKVADLLLRARAMYLKPKSPKNFGVIEALSRQALELEPNNADAMLMLATALALEVNNFGAEMDANVGEKNYVEARDLALKAKELDPDNPRIYTVLGVYAKAHDDYSAYRRAAETRLSLEPKNPSAYNNLAFSLINGGEPQKAIELLKQAIAVDPKHPNEVILQNMAEAYFMLGDNDATIEWFLKSLEINTKFPDPYVYLAMVYELKGDHSKSRAAVSDLSRVSPNFKLSVFRTVGSSSPAAYKEWYEKKYLPLGRKAGLSE